jgi:AraC family transcriptional regulator, L-rhamnose operon transcriptional activator RhaR
MDASPVAHSVEGLMYLTDGALAYAGRHVHEHAHAVHTHNFMEIAFVVGGRGVHRCLTGHHRLEVGDVVLLRPAVWHGYDDCDDLVLYNCCVSTQLFQRELAWTRDDPLLGYLLWTGPLSMARRGLLTATLDPAALRECETHLRALDQLRRKPYASYRSDIVGRLSLVLGCVARAVAADRQPPSTPAKPTHPAVQQAIQLMEARLAHRWTLTELSEALHLAPRYLVRLFKSATGLPPIAYLSRRRAETAAVLLLDTTLPVSQIGRIVGWPDQNYLARRFRAHFGLSATTYRARFAHHRVQLQAWPPEVDLFVPPSDGP